MSGSGISWAVRKSAPRSRQITTTASHHSVFYRLDALPAAQPTASKHWRHNTATVTKTVNPSWLWSQLWITNNHNLNHTKEQKQCIMGWVDGIQKLRCHGESPPFTAATDAVLLSMISITSYKEKLCPYTTHSIWKKCSNLFTSSHKLSLCASKHLPVFLMKASVLNSVIRNYFTKYRFTKYLTTILRLRQNV